MHHAIKMVLSFILVFAFMPALGQKIESGVRYRALVIGIDGLKGVQFYERAFIQNQAPNLKFIADQGQYSTCANVQDTHCAHAQSMPRFDSNYAWVTASGWASVLTGVNSDKHSVKNNDFQHQSHYYQLAKQFPTFLSRLKQQGLITAVGGVGNFLTSMNGTDDNLHLSIGIVDFECGVNAAGQSSSVAATASSSCNVDYRQSLNGSDPGRDDKLTAWLLSMINLEGAKSPDLIMGVYDTVDGAGHHYGYSSNSGYMTAISKVDDSIGLLIQAIQKRISLNNEAWLIIMTSDHGGHVNQSGGGSHNNVPMDDEVIPFVIGVLGKNIALTHRGAMNESTITQMDVNPSVLYWFGIRPNTNAIVRSEYHRAGL